MPRAVMIELDYAKLAATPVSTDPFPHVVVPGFVPPASLKAVLGRPSAAWQTRLISGGFRQARSPRRGVDGGDGRSAAAAAIERLFGLDLRGSPTMVTLRGWTSERDGRIHCDSLAKRVTVLLYLNPETDAWSRQDGCLRLLRDPTDLEDFAVEVPPVNGTLLVFPNGPTTWHGHRQFVGQRYSVQLNYMTTDDKARSELRRHRISAFVKRLTRAA